MNCSEIDCDNNLDKTCTSDSCILNVKLKRVEAPYDEESKGCKGCYCYQSDYMCIDIPVLPCNKDLRYCHEMDGVNYIYVKEVQ